MNLFDYLLLTVVLVFAVIGILRGFVREIFSLVLWPFAALLAWLFAGNLSEALTFVGSDPTVRLVSAFVIIFMFVFVLGMIAIYSINRLLPLRGSLRTPNMVLGGIVGGLRGGVIIVIVFLAAGITSLPQGRWWRQSLIAPYFESAALAASQYLPRDVARHIRYG